MILGARSLASTWLLLSLVFLVYSTICVTLFEANDPFHFGGIQMAMWTFFELSTFDVSTLISYDVCINAFIVTELERYFIHQYLRL